MIIDELREKLAPLIDAEVPANLEHPAVRIGPGRVLLEVREGAHGERVIVTTTLEALVQALQLPDHAKAEADVLEAAARAAPESGYGPYIARWRAEGLL